MSKAKSESLLSSSLSPPNTKNVGTHWRALMENLAPLHGSTVGIDRDLTHTTNSST